MPAPHHSVFTGRMPFLPPNQQRQSTEGIKMIKQIRQFKCYVFKNLHMISTVITVTDYLSYTNLLSNINIIVATPDIQQDHSITLDKSHAHKRLRYVQPFILKTRAFMQVCFKTVYFNICTVPFSGREQSSQCWRTICAV